MGKRGKKENKDDALFNVLDRSLKIGPKNIKNKKGVTVRSSNTVLTGSWEGSGWFLGKDGKDGKSELVVKIEDNFNKLVTQFNDKTIVSIKEVPEILREDLPSRLLQIKTNIEMLSTKEVINDEKVRQEFIDAIGLVKGKLDKLDVDVGKAQEQANARAEQQITFKNPGHVVPGTGVTLELLAAKTDGGGTLQLFTENGEPITSLEIPDVGEFTCLIRASETDTYKAAERVVDIEAKKGSPQINWKLPQEIGLSTQLTLKLINATPTTEDGKLEIIQPINGKFDSVGVKSITVVLKETKTHISVTKNGTINVVKAKQQIEWKPPDVTYPIEFTNAQRNAIVKQGIKSKLPNNAYTFPSLKVGKAKLQLVVPGDDNWLETKVEIEINVLPPTPPTLSGNKKLACEKAKISYTMQGKIIDGQKKPGVEKKVRGGHSAKILKDKNNYNTQEVELNNDGTASVKFKMKFENGDWSDLKTSTVAPGNWDDNAILAATIEVGKEEPKYRRTDGTTLHTKKVNGVQWDVIKDVTGKVTASYPTGGNITSENAFKKKK